MHLFIGTYISDSDDTIYHLQINNTLEVVSKKLIHAGKNPSFLILNKNKDRMYCVNELSKEADGECGNVCFLKKERDNYVIHKKFSTQGEHPCHISMSYDEKLLFVTNYTSGSLSVYALDDDGNLDTLIEKVNFSGSSIHPDRQASPHAHETLSSLCGKYLFLTDLGCDKINVYSIHTCNKDRPLIYIDEIDVPKGIGPRHMAFDMTGDFLYVSGELSSSVLVFRHKEGKLQFLQEMKIFPHEVQPYPRTSCSEIAYHKGKVYVGNRGDNTISVYQQQEDGTLTLLRNISTGDTPRHFLIVDNHDLNTTYPVLIVGNQDANSLMMFEIDGIQYTLIKEITECTSPVCVCK